MNTLYNYFIVLYCTLLMSQIFSIWIISVKLLKTKIIVIMTRLHVLIIWILLKKFKTTYFLKIFPLIASLTSFANIFVNGFEIHLYLIQLSINSIKQMTQESILLKINQENFSPLFFKINKLIQIAQFEEKIYCDLF